MTKNTREDDNGSGMDPVKTPNGEEMRAINERLVIASVRQQEHAESAREAERRAEEILGQLRAAHEGLHATHAHLQETLAAVQAAYERERRITQVLQRRLLLETPEDAFPGLSVATLYSAAWLEDADVGGDFYDAFLLPDERIALLVGDVTGKGLLAAAHATEAKDVLRAFLRTYPYYPAVTLTRLNDYLCDVQELDARDADTVMGLSLAVVNLKSSEVIFAWGGIETPLFVPAGEAVRPLTGGGLLLGAMPHATYSEVTLPFRAGDAFVLSTDGLSEARRGQEFLNPAGVMRLVEEARSEPTLQAMGKAVLSGARAFANGRLQDDACLVIARRN